MSGGQEACPPSEPRAKLEISGLVSSLINLLPHLHELCGTAACSSLLARPLDGTDSTGQWMEVGCETP